MRNAVTCQLSGTQAIIEAFQELHDDITKRVLRDAVSKGARIVVNAAKAGCPTETGLLKKSLGFVVKPLTKAGRSGYMAIIGPRRGFKEQVIYNARKGSFRRLRTSDIKAGRHLGKMQWRDPAKYAHLVEFGHQIAVGGTLSKRRGGRSGRAGLGTAKRHMVVPRPFMRDAWDSTRGEVLSTIAAELRARVAKVRAKRVQEAWRGF